MNFFTDVVLHTSVRCQWFMNLINERRSAIWGKKHQVSIDAAKMCWQLAGCNARMYALHITPTINRKKPKTISDHCLMCGQCGAVCPKKPFPSPIILWNEIRDKGRGGRLNPDDVLNVVRFRRTIRQFKQKEIPSEVISQILEAGETYAYSERICRMYPLADVLDREKIVLSKWRSAFFQRVKT